MKIVVVAVGIPASGKSTWFKNNVGEPLSSDELRFQMFGNYTEQRHNNRLFAVMRGMLHARLGTGKSIEYIDATNLTVWERQHWIKIAKQYDYEAWALYFDTPLDKCLLRNSLRNRVVPNEVIERMASRLEPPTEAEGFDKVITVGSSNS